MTRCRPITSLVTAAAIPPTPLAVSACGGSGDGATAVTSPASTPATAPASTDASAAFSATNSSLGSILVDSRGCTLYLFKADSGTNSAGATTWPAVLATVNRPPVIGVTASKLGTTARAGGTQQVTYTGQPHYRYAGDEARRRQRSGPHRIRRRLVRTLASRQPVR